jgi:hypothetical protein
VRVEFLVDDRAIGVCWLEGDGVAFDRSVAWVADIFVVDPDAGRSSGRRIGRTT